MRRLVLDLAIVATIVFAVLFVYEPISTELAVDLLLLTVGGLLLLLLVHSARTAAPRTGRSALEAALRARPPADLAPAQLLTTQRRVELGVARAADLHFHLRPMLREIAAGRLASRHGIELDGPRAQVLLGDEAWDVVRPDRPPPEERFGPGIPLDELGRILDRLERI